MSRLTEKQLPRRSRLRRRTIQINEEREACLSDVGAASGGEQKKEKYIVKKTYQQNNLRKTRIYDSRNPYFVTFCAYRMREILIKHNVPEILIDSMKWFSDNSKIILLGFVIMPDHIHWAFALREGNRLDNVIRRYKSFTANAIMNKPRKYGAKFWQDGYYDHLLRSTKDFEVKLNYMHNNPVRKGLADRPEEYLYSTANERYAHLIDWEYVM